MTLPSSTADGAFHHFFNHSSESRREERLLQGSQTVQRGSRLRQAIPFFFRRVGAGAAEQRVGKLLSELNARLIEGIDSIKLPRIRGRDLEQHHQPADMPRIDSIEMDREIRAPALGQRAGCRPLLDVDQLSRANARRDSRAPSLP